MKRLVLAACILLLAANALTAQTVLNIVNFGAVGNGSTFNTAAIQRAIDSASSLVGGGIVQVPAGRFRTKTIVLKSHVTLQLDSGATLLAPTSISDYSDYPFPRLTWSRTYTKKCLIYAANVEHIKILGKGTIDGQGVQLAYLQTTTKERPHGIRMFGCKNVEIAGVKFLTAPQWMIHIEDSDTIHIHNIDLYNQGLGSNDGIDIDACREVLIEDCNIDSNDDPCVVKSHSEVTSRNVEVRRCTLATYERGVKVGNESCGGFENIWFHDIQIKSSTFTIPGNPVKPASAIYISVTDGGYMDGIKIERINSSIAYETPIFICLNNRGNRYVDTIPPLTVKYLRNVLIRDVEIPASTTIPCSITGIPNHVVENVRLENVRITVPGNGPNVAPSAVIPELETTRPEHDMWKNNGSVDLPAYGIYVRHVAGLQLDSVCFTLQAADARLRYVMSDTSGVAITHDCPAVVLATAPNQSTRGLLIYPNPVLNELHLSSHVSLSDELRIVDLTGRAWPIKLLSPNCIDVSQLAPGSYVLSMKGYASKFLKE